ncbi:unnamed protein product [Pseudo-nitzschia multistriata]|uniref:Calcineurin-like phosphoesterase domain-containing protein n=1 Tax=Pseudo-nitzschia multistriata TaxID=183589 RepID=A0A448Z477_9STRA|nr:unnamed protein product [Pseudo-nitzschia multistriata]
MADDEEPPALGAAPPAAAFSTGGPPPPAAFARPPAAAPPPVPAAAASDLNSRWKQYESEKASGSTRDAHENYDLYETPEKLKRSSSTSSSSSSARNSLAGSSRQLYGEATANPSTASEEPRRAYSFSKSSSYDTNALIAKYAGVSGVAGGSPPRSNNNNNKAPSSSVLPSTARAEAMQVLSMADNRTATADPNQPFQVRRTESGGFRASAFDPSVEEPSTYRFQRSSSNSRRTPSALKGLGMGSGSASASGGSAGKPDWKSARYSFRDPQFRDDDCLEEEDEIVGPAAEAFEDEVEVRPKDSFRGDFPARTSAWSSRYSDDPKLSSVLDRYDRSHSGSHSGEHSGQRTGARGMLVSTAANVSDSVRNFGDSVSSRISEARENAKNTGFGSGKFSFKKNRIKKQQQQMQMQGLVGSPSRPGATGSTNLRTVWQDGSDGIGYHDDDGDQGITGGSGKHKSWEQVMREKKRRRVVGLSVLCALVAVVIVGVSVSQTAWRWKYKNLWGNGNTQLEVTFYATSNSPLGYGTSEEQLAADLANLPGDADFVAHLGNLQDASVNMCPASRMPEMGSLLRSRMPENVPLFIVPGEHDWIRCPNQLTALARWMEVFATSPLEDQAASDDDYTAEPAIAALQALEFDRPKTSPDIFSKLHHGVLVFGLHLVQGTVTDGMGMQEQVVRDEKMSIFVKGTLSRLEGQYRAIVMLGNARPGPRQQGFFDSISEPLANARVPVAYVHAGSSLSGKSDPGGVVHYPFGKKKKRGDGLSGMVAIRAPSGGNHEPPLKITVGFGKHLFGVGSGDDQ